MFITYLLIGLFAEMLIGLLAGYLIGRKHSLHDLEALRNKLIATTTESIMTELQKFQDVATAKSKGDTLDLVKTIKKTLGTYMAEEYNITLREAEWSALLDRILVVTLIETQANKIQEGNSDHLANLI